MGGANTSCVPVAIWAVVAITGKKSPLETGAAPSQSLVARYLVSPSTLQIATAP